MSTEPFDSETIASLNELGEGFFDQMLDVFLGDLGPAIASMRGASESGDGVTLSRAAHRLKSACANLGANKLAKLCAAVELRAKQGELEIARNKLELLVAEAAVVEAWATQHKAA